MASSRAARKGLGGERRDDARGAGDDSPQDDLPDAPGPVGDEDRWRLLLDAVVAMSADLSLDGALDRIVAVAGRVVGARYVALGVLSERSGHGLRTFIHHGIPTPDVERIGDLPTGQGLLGLLIDRPQPLRLQDLDRHPVSSGFPADHPPMRSFLGVPVRIRDKVFGNLYLSEKQDGSAFTQADEDTVVALAAAAGVVIENARLQEEAARRERWLSANADITRLLASGSPGGGALQMIADRARDLAGADIAWIVTGLDASDLALRVVSGGGAELVDLTSVPLTDSVSAKVLRSGTPQRLEDVANTEYVKPVAAGWPDLGPAIFLPLAGPTGPEGVLGLGWAPGAADRFYEVDPELPASFAEHASLALQVARHRDDERRVAVFKDRDRIARDLHDLVIQRLFATGLGLQGMGRLVEHPEVAQRLDSAVQDLDATIKDIRMTIFELGSVPHDSDIQAEVTKVTDRAAHELGFRPRVRFEGPVRTRITHDVKQELLAVLVEALSNVARHAEASEVRVTVSALTRIELTVQDDGRGIPSGVVPSGLANMRHRAEGLGGECEIVSAPGHGTTIRWTVPTD